VLAEVDEVELFAMRYRVPPARLEERDALRGDQLAEEGVSGLEGAGRGALLDLELDAGEELAGSKSPARIAA
jgi:hypothetical protein